MKRNENYDGSKKSREKDRGRESPQAHHRGDDLAEYQLLVQSLQEYILSNMSLMADMQSYEAETCPDYGERQSKKKLIYVEGDSDAKFYRGYLKAGVSAENVSGIIEIYNSLKGKEAERHNKETVINLIEALTYGERVGITISPEITENYDIYGIIDKDFEDDNKPSIRDRLRDRLFVTDTHDLETLILSKDKDVVYRLKCCKITKDEYEKALFLAYQLGEIKYKLRQKDMKKQASYLTIRELFYESIDLKFDPRINLSEVIVVINRCVDEENKNKSKDRVSKRTKAIKACLKDMFDEDNYFEAPLSKFCSSLPTDLWNVANGHDIVAALRCIKGIRINEGDLIETYDKEKFYNTALAQRMQEHCLI